MNNRRDLSRRRSSHPPAQPHGGFRAVVPANCPEPICYDFLGTARRQQATCKHGVTFGEAQTVFGDALALDIDDPVHSQDERRCVIIGLSERERLLVVVYAERELDTIRIVSAQARAARERRFYEDF